MTSEIAFVCAKAVVLCYECAFQPFQTVSHKVCMHGSRHCSSGADAPQSNVDCVGQLTTELTGEAETAGNVGFQSDVYTQPIMLTELSVLCSCSFSSSFASLQNT